MNKTLIAVLTTAALLCATNSRADTVEDLLKSYAGAGAKNFDAARGEALWKQTFPDPETGKTVSCTTCHTENLREAGKHAKTGKVIEPMAPSVNKERLTDAKHIEKWFKRNCEGTLGRECTPQEKGDVLMFLRSQ